MDSYEWYLRASALCVLVVPCDWQLLEVEALNRQDSARNARPEVGGRAVAFDNLLPAIQGDRAAHKVRVEGALCLIAQTANRDSIWSHFELRADELAVAVHDAGGVCRY